MSTVNTPQQNMEAAQAQLEKDGAAMAGLLSAKNTADAAVTTAQQNAAAADQAYQTGVQTLASDAIALKNAIDAYVASVETPPPPAV